MNNRYIYHPGQDTIITRISEVSLLPGPNHCFPLKRTSFIFYHHKLVLPSFNPYINRITEYVPLGFGFFCSTFLRNPCMLLNVAVVHLFSLLYCIHFYKYTHIFLSILLLMDMRGFFSNFGYYGKHCNYCSCLCCRYVFVVAGNIPKGGNLYVMQYA